MEELLERIRELEEKIYILENYHVKSIEDRLSALEYCTDTEQYYE